jgi:hypothetical protein
MSTLDQVIFGMLRFCASGDGRSAEEDRLKGMLLGP